MEAERVLLDAPPSFNDFLFLESTITLELKTDRGLDVDEFSA